ncbi:MAG: hypothetical protein ACE5OR_01295 [bacterium]
MRCQGVGIKFIKSKEGKNEVHQSSIRPMRQDPCQPDGLRLSLDAGRPPVGRSGRSGWWTGMALSGCRKLLHCSAVTYFDDLKVAAEKGEEKSEEQEGEEKPE